jgi:2-polyprenyl-3-methyl-5-hydroxy-6-metoxy-1,4-benzoquinol methylase
MSNMLADDQYQRLIDTFCKPQSNLYRKLRSIVSTTHLDPIIENPKAVNCKLNRTSYIAQTIMCSDKRILDYGSGMGFLACFLASEGAEHVTGVEILEQHRKVSSFLAKEVFKVKNIEFLEYEEGFGLESFDVGLLNNVISHVNNPLKLLLDLTGLLKPYGLLFIEDNNNLASFIVRKKMSKRWQPAEKSYLPKRYEYIEKISPESSKGQIQSLAEYTYGLNYPEISRFVLHYMEYGKKPFDTSYLKHCAPIDPDVCIYHENGFYPKELETILFNAGLVPISTRAKYVFDFKAHLIVSKIFQWFPKFSLHIAPAFEIMAIKK